jgi:hypothetical protein
MALCCGCEFRGGMNVSRETIKAHYKHTFEVLLFWEMLHRIPPIDPERTMKLSQARIDLIDAIDELYPEVKED